MIPAHSQIVEMETPVRKELADFPPSHISETYLEQRFSAMPRRTPSVFFECTDDVGLTHQYELLCKDRYAAMMGLEGPEHTGDSTVLVARAKNQTIGGCRLSTKEPEAEAVLPVETHGLNLARLFPDLPVTSVRLMEISDMAMLPDYQSSIVMDGLCLEALQYAAARNVRLVFALAPVSLAKTYSKAADTFGLRCNIFQDVPVSAESAYEGEKLVLCLMDLAPLYKKKLKKNQQLEEKTLVAG